MEASKRILSLEARILSLSETPRNKKLTSELKMPISDSHLVVSVFVGFNGNVQDYSKHSVVDFAGNFLVLGRALTSPEVACLLGHRFIHANVKSEWLLVLEDDAVLIDSEHFLELLNSITECYSDDPTVISLFAGKHGVLSPKWNKQDVSHGLLTFIKPTTGCVAYLINSKAREISISAKKIIGVADWPLWINECKFFQTSNPIFGILNSAESYISQDMPENYKSVTPYFTKGLFSAISGLFHSRLVAIYGGRINYGKIIIYPKIVKIRSHLSRNRIT